MPWLTARRNVELALRLRGVPRRERREKALALLDTVNLADAAEKRPHELSGGMRQRVALARALAQDRPVLLMDEPFAALDAITRDLLHEELERVWRATGRTIVFVTHNVREAARLGAARRPALEPPRPRRRRVAHRADGRAAHRVARGRGALDRDHRPAAEGDPPKCRMTTTRRRRRAIGRPAPALGRPPQPRGRPRPAADRSADARPSRWRRIHDERPAARHLRRRC